MRRFLGGRRHGGCAVAILASVLLESEDLSNDIEKKNGFSELESGKIGHEREDAYLEMQCLSTIVNTVFKH